MIATSHIKRATSINNPQTTLLVVAPDVEAPNSLFLSLVLPLNCPTLKTSRRRPTVAQRHADSGGEESDDPGLIPAIFAQALDIVQKIVGIPVKQFPNDAAIACTRRRPVALQRLDVRDLVTFSLIATGARSNRREKWETNATPVGFASGEHFIIETSTRALLCYFPDRTMPNEVGRTLRAAQESVANMRWVEGLQSAAVRKTASLFALPSRWAVEAKEIFFCRGQEEYIRIHASANERKQ
ncbi:hypothetical protein B0H17DRAFT_1137199 [Mycena rosella]|uniref:Uncharacterized protein n=1 Tax=Mycena rosella TaxID=1033263 RepID=A0AAD7GDN9_MYCRO|nr:hypothetical protein B0H17DRAFT_1137199 [Mycena rosella]